MVEPIIYKSVIVVLLVVSGGSVSATGYFMYQSAYQNIQLDLYKSQIQILQQNITSLQQEITALQGQIQTRPSQATETIHIQAASFTASTGAFTIYVQNAGTQSVTYQQEFLLNAGGSVLASASSTATGSSGSITTLTGSMSGTFTASQQYILQVVSARGTSAEITITAS